MLLTATDFRKNIEKEPSTQGVKRDTLKKFQIVSFIMPTYTENFMKIRSRVFPEYCSKTNKIAKPAEMKT